MRIDCKQLSRHVGLFAVVAVVSGSPRVVSAQAVAADTSRLAEVWVDSVPQSMEPAAVTRANATSRVQARQSKAPTDRLDGKAILVMVVIGIVAIIAAANGM